MDVGEIHFCINLVATALKARDEQMAVPSCGAIADPALVGKLPDWIARYGLLKDGEQVWLFCEPRPEADAASQGQLLLHLPPGRYWVVVFELASSACIGRESTAGGPLVAGLPFTGHPVLLWIHPITL